VKTPIRSCTMASKLPICFSELSHETVLCSLILPDLRYQTKRVSCAVTADAQDCALMHLAPLENELVARSVADYVEGSLQDRPKLPKSHADKHALGDHR